DLHGNADSWHAHLKSMGAYGVDRIIVLGDVIDRGAQSLKIFEDIVEGVKQNIMIFVKGNHEDFLLKSIDGNREMLIEWAQNGGDKTLSEFGINIKMGYQNSFMVDVENSREDTSMSDRVFERLLARHSQPTIYVGDEISDLNAISSNLKLREIASWLRVNSNDYAVDIYGNLANHTGNILSEKEKTLIEMVPKPRIIHGHEERMDIQSACSNKINIDVGARFWLFVGQEGIFFVNQKGEKMNKGALSSRVFLNQVARRISALSDALVKD
ncbi:MAG: hypothetical protein GYA55_06840, partial [SAR324 cluster bacterium]|nr:hypothetical protein [SAR324 cluster bacterium]